MATRFNLASASFVTGAPVEPAAAWAGMAMDDLAQQEIEHSAVLKLEQGEFLSVCLKMFRTKHVAWLPGTQTAVLVGDNGECCAIDAAGVEHDEYVTTSSRNPRNTGHIRAATRIGDEVIAVGMQRQVYRRTASGRWVDMMQGIAQNKGEPVAGFECVLALSENEIYAAGWRGELWLFDGQAWQAIDSPTNRILTALCLGPTGDVVGCGQRGVLIRGRGHRWRVIDDAPIPDDLWAIAASGDKIFMSSLLRMYAWTGQGVELLDLDALGASTFGALIPGNGVIWSMGQKDFLAFDGQQWRRLA